MEGRWPRGLASIEAEIRRNGRIRGSCVALRRAIYGTARSGATRRVPAPPEPAEPERRSRLGRVLRRGADRLLLLARGHRQRAHRGRRADAVRVDRRGDSARRPDRATPAAQPDLPQHASSERFRALVLRAVERSVLHSDHALFGHPGSAPGRDRPRRRRGDPPPGLRQRQPERPRDQPGRGRVPVRAEPRHRGRGQRPGLARAVRQGDHHAPPVRRRLARAGRRAGGARG